LLGLRPLLEEVFEHAPRDPDHAVALTDCKSATKWDPTRI
jgi:hypothetical protein